MRQQTFVSLVNLGLDCKTCRLATLSEADTLPAGSVAADSSNCCSARSVGVGECRMVSFYDDLPPDKRITADASSRNPVTWSPFRLSPIAVSVVTGAFDFLLVVATAAAAATAYSRETGRVVTA